MAPEKWTAHPRWWPGSGFTVEVELASDLAPLAPGKFAMLSPADGKGPLVPRPFSVLDQPSPRHLTFLVQVMGPGTQALARVPIGGSLRVLVPLGNGFTLPDPSRPVVLVAGGVGCVPFLLYLRARAAAGAADQTRLLYGARSQQFLWEREALEAASCAVEFMTEDGSLGFHGNVLAAMEQGLNAGTIPKEALFCACGPSGLLRAFWSRAKELGLDSQVSLETYMGCGFGACNACPVATDPLGGLGDWPWAKACTAGPVFAVQDILFA